MKIYNVDAKINCANNPKGVVGVPAGTHALQSMIDITCSETDIWDINKGNPWSKCNANGASNLHRKVGEQTFLVGSLLGSWDDGKTFFSIGLSSQISVCAANADGGAPNLTLYCMDSYGNDNQGTIAVTINEV
jgi:hypothetical protein